MSNIIATYTWNNPPAPGTMVRFVSDSFVYSCNKVLLANLNELAMVIELLPLANLVRLLLYDGVVVELYCAWPEKMHLKPA